MKISLVPCEILPESKLLATMPAKVFDSFMYCPFVFTKTSFGCCLMVALTARVFDSFMYCHFVFKQDFLLMYLDGCFARKGI